MIKEKSAHRKYGSEKRAINVVICLLSVKRFECFALFFGLVDAIHIAVCKCAGSVVEKANYLNLSKFPSAEDVFFFASTFCVNFDLR